MKKKEIIWMFIICCIVAIVSCTVTIGIYEKRVHRTKDEIEEDSITATTESGRITPSTKMVYGV